MKTGIGIGISPVFIPVISVADEWTPASPTDDGGVLPHTWFYAGQPEKWIDSAKTIPAVSDGDLLGAMTNQGSNSFDILQTNTTRKPTLKLNIKNGEPVLRHISFDSLAGLFSGGAVSQPMTFFYVVLASVNNNVIVDAAVALSGVIFGTGGGRYYIAAPTIRTGSLIDANYHIFTNQANTVNSWFWKNGIVEFSSQDIGSYTMDGVTLGARSGGVGNPFVGDLAEVLMYDSNLSTADKNQLGLYLSAKYDINYTDI